MTAEQLNELADALLVLSAKSSVLKERDELRALMEENLQVEEVCMAKAFLIGGITIVCLGFYYAIWRTHTTHSFYAEQNRHSTSRIRQSGGQFIADDICGCARQDFRTGP